MARLPRLHVPGGFYHVTLRGNHRQRIFLDPGDRGRLDEIVATALQRGDARLHSYCWMTNHLHMLVQVGDRPLGELIQRIGTRFARAVQKRVPTTGHLFENRYHASLVDSDAYFLKLLCYIHLNPVHAGITATPALYPWSSHAEYEGVRHQWWVTTQFGLQLFHLDSGRARELYLRFISAEAGALALGLADSLKEQPFEACMPGDDRFPVQAPKVNVEPRISVSLEQLANTICDDAGVSLSKVTSASQVIALARVRGRIAASALEQKVASLSQVARFLNRSASAISRAATRYKNSAKMQT